MYSESKKMINFSKEYAETDEKEPFCADIRVDFKRHRKPVYTEEENKTGNFEGELDLMEQKKAEEDALELVREIDKEKELVIILSSTKRRAFQTAEAYKDVFEKRGIEIYAGIVIMTNLLKDVSITSDFLKEFKEEIKEGKASYREWMDWWVRKGENLPENVDKPKDVRSRVEKLIGYFEKIEKEIYLPQNHRLHFICFGHEETMRDILEEGYGIGTKVGESPDYGEGLRVDMRKSTSEKDAILNLSYKGKSSNISFDRKEGKIYKNNQ